MNYNSAESLAREASDIEESHANYLEESRPEDLFLSEEAPSSQFNTPSLPTRSRVVRDEIPDSEDEAYYGVSEDESSQAQPEPISHSSPPTTNLDDLPHEIPTDTPLTARQTYHYNRFRPDYRSTLRSDSEIPDSQEDHSPYLADDEPDDFVIWYPHQESRDPYDDQDWEGELIDEYASFHTDDTEIVPGGTNLTTPGKYFPLHLRGINANGRLAREAPQYRDMPMDEEPTQAATQLNDDTRRAGTSGSLCFQDEADVIAILHPTSPAAHVAICLTAEASPQHILQNHDKLYVDDNDGADLGDSPSNKDKLQDIALRFSSRVNDIRLGFVFGRNIHHSDILLVRDERMDTRAQTEKQQNAVSNKHFRIFVNRYGILMLEDTSTNGTVVDNTVLHGPKAQDQIRNPQPRKTLHMGNIIEIPTTGSGESIRFVVTVPQRYQAERNYQENLQAYLACVDQAVRKAAAIADAEAKKKSPPDVPDLTNALPAGRQQHITPTTSIIFPGGNNHGLHWNGGEKYNVVGHIGAGAFATVCKLSSKRDGEVFAVKQLEKRRFLKDGIANSKFYNELNLMMSARHPNIVEYRDHHETETHLFIVMEFIPYGDLRLWTDRKEPMTEYMAARVGRQMLDAMTYLHNQGITHRDIKPDNILVAGDDPQDKIFKLSDFGLSKQVVNDQTFLQTFCGTVLYLAPEVYPGYQEARFGRTPRPRRARGTAAALPYEHSVDIWSLGTVLFQLLAGSAPFNGKTGDNGEQFLHTVINEPVDYELLKYEGVTDDGIDFISKMLVIDPKTRARETDLMNHPWLVPKPYPVPRNVHTSDETEIPDASQLSLAENFEDSRETKRLRGNAWTGGDDYDLRETEDDEMIPEGLTYSERYKGGYNLRLSAGPPPPQTQSQLWPTRPQTERLFGEIGSSALQSSGLLGQNAHAALEVSMEEGSGEEDNGRPFQERGRSNSASAGATHVNTPQSDVTDRIIPGNLQYRQTTNDPQDHTAAPSLLGAEALVGQLNMDSIGSGGSASFAGGKPASPDAHPIHETLSTSRGVKRSNQVFGPSADESNRKDSETSIRPSSGHKKHRSSNSPNQKRSSASKANTKISAENAQTTEDVSIAGGQSQQTSQESTSENRDGQQSRGRGKTVSLPDTAINSQGSISKASTSSNGSKGVAASHGDMSPPASINPSMDLAPPSGSTLDGFVKPSMRFGNLRLIQGSIPSVRQIKITSMGTSFGRDPSSKYVHPNRMDTRVPKNAFDIQMWYPGMGRDLRAGKAEWANNPNLVAVISTRTSIRIAVNGISLKKGENCWLFGRLKTGDVISAIELPEGKMPKTDHEREYIRYHCEFFIGASKEVRKENEPFTVEQEDDKYQKYYARKMREGSVVAPPPPSRTAAVFAPGGSVTTAAAAPTQPTTSTTVETSTTTTTVPTNNPLGNN